MAKENWAERAAELGWHDLELFGCCRRPLERLGNAGLLWAINGGRLVELRAATGQLSNVYQTNLGTFTTGSARRPLTSRYLGLAFGR
jgi:hypothetical protein